MKTEEPLIGHEIKVSIKVEETRPLLEEIIENDAENEEESKEGKMRPGLVVPVTRFAFVTFVDQSHVLFFSEFTPLFFKSGMSYVGQVRR